MARIDLAQSPIGFGAFKIGRNQDVKYPQPFELPDLREVEALLNGLLDLGIHYIDTAPAYGLSEERIGQTIGHRRREYLLSTKVGETFERGVSAYDFSRRAVRQSIHRSLKRLRTDLLDLVFIHAGRDDVTILKETDVVATLCALRDEGCIRAIGLSGHSEAAFRTSLDWSDAFMLTYHPEDRSLEPLIAEAARRGVSVIVKKPLASGTLSADKAIPFALRNPGVVSVVVGSLNLSHMQENLRSAEQIRPRSGDPNLKTSPGGS